ncbi:29931_t:CDS:1, partial [Gigaspora margarita]
MNQPTNQTFAVQRQNNNRQLRRPQNIGRQTPRPQNTSNLFTDTFTAVQQYNDLVEGSDPFVRTQGVESSPQ